MSVDQRVSTRLRELLEMGERVLQTKREPGAGMIGFDSWVDSEKAHQWFTSAQNLLVRVLGEESAHYKNFSAVPGRQGLSYSPVRRGQGILRAALDDFERGYLFNVRQLIEAEVFVDLLDQATELCRAGYVGPAAVVAGCVIEDCLRRLCARVGLQLSAKPKLDQMNADLAKAGVYNKLVQKRLTAIADLRNNAAHGNWADFDSGDVEEMIDWIGKFLETHQERAR